MYSYKNNQETKTVVVKKKTKTVPKKKTKKVLSTVKKNIINNSKLIKYNKTKLLTHGIHHSKKHILYMIKKMNQGNSFKNSHKMTMDQVGN